MIREAKTSDIPSLQVIRNSVTENALSDPSLVPYEAYVEFLEQRGKGWVYIIEDVIAGFAVADLKENNIWALFVSPLHERKGIGKKLHDIMMSWYFDQHKLNVWLSTSPGTKAEKFYRKAGWKEDGTYGK